MWRRQNASGICPANRERPRMVFRRRDRRPTLTALREAFLPRGGWKRATQYVVHRLRRLPDPPHRIARGVFVGVFISFTPLFGIHLIGAVLLAWLVRGNVLAAVFATFFGNPVTIPLMGIGAVEAGHVILGRTDEMGIEAIFQAFSSAWTSIWHNLLAPFTSYTAEWGGLVDFFRNIFLPYLVGGVPLGIIFGLICYYATLPVISTYQRLRERQRRERVEKAIEKRLKAAEKQRKRVEKAALREASSEDQG